MVELVRESVVESYKESLAPGVWEGMSEEERDGAVRAHAVVCHNHLRSTMLRQGIKEELSFLKEALAEALEELSPEEHVTLHVDGICRAAAKKFFFSASNMYAKGKGATFLAWCIANHSKCIVNVLPQADLGTRLDSSTDVALALYMNRKLYLEWLEVRLAGMGAESKLETCL